MIHSGHPQRERIDERRSSVIERSDDPRRAPARAPLRAKNRPTRRPLDRADHGAPSPRTPETGQPAGPDLAGLLPARPGGALRPVRPQTGPGHPARRRRGQLHPLRAGQTPQSGREGQDHPGVERSHPGDPARAGSTQTQTRLRPGFSTPQHERSILLALASTHAICPRCEFDLIDQKRPDCPECAWAIVPSKLIYPDAPPKPGYTRLLAGSVGLHWLAIFLAALAAPSAPAPACALLLTFFTLQAWALWRAVNVLSTPSVWTDLDATHRLPHWRTAFALAGAGALGVIAAFLLWMLT